MPAKAKVQIKYNEMPAKLKVQLKRKSSEIEMPAKAKVQIKYKELAAKNKKCGLIDAVSGVISY